ncbi:MAG: protein-glutamine gamma-glutamyltransferase [Candidatus Pristimantibacillus sp.]
MISGSDVGQINQMALSEQERSILQSKQNSPIVYRYDSAEALRFELAMRASIVNAAKAMQASEVRFETFENSKCNERYWTRTSTGGFQLKNGMSPSDAINDIFINGNLYGFECATAIVIIWYKAVLDMIGKAAFDAYFTKLYLRDWNHDSDLWLISTNDNKEIFQGDVLYFKNPDHDPETPEWQGENVVLLADNLFFGHGIGIETGEDIIAALNKARFPGARRSAYLSDLVVFPNFEYIRRLSTTRIEELLLLGNNRLIEV